MKIAIPEHFKLQELVDEKTFKALGGSAWKLLDPNAVVLADRLRADYGPATINNWHWGGEFQYSGFRPIHCGIGADHSQHRLGKAWDIKFRDYTAQKVRDELSIAEKFSLPLPYSYIGGIEKDVSWLHIDVRPTVDGKIIWFKG